MMDMDFATPFLTALLGSPVAKLLQVTLAPIALWYSISTRTGPTYTGDVDRGWQDPEG